MLGSAAEALYAVLSEGAEQSLNLARSGHFLEGIAILSNYALKHRVFVHILLKCLHQQVTD
jgi:hypothetical protein